MRIVGVQRPGAATAVQTDIPHGKDPRKLLWDAGWVLVRPLATYLDQNDEVVMSVQVTPRKARSKAPKIKERGVDPDLVVAAGEEPVENQRIAAYALVRSKFGVLGTQCSEKTAIPGLWQLPGGGLEAGETPSEGVIREIYEETGQRVKIRRLIDLQSDHWVGRGPTGRLEDFQALRIFYSAVCPEPRLPQVFDIDGTTSTAAWIPLTKWRSLPWTAGSRSILDRHLWRIPLVY